MLANIVTSQNLEDTDTNSGPNLDTKTIIKLEPGLLTLMIEVCFVWLVFFCFFPQDRVSLRSLSCPGTRSVDQVRLNLTEICMTDSASRVLGLKVIKVFFKSYLCILVFCLCSTHVSYRQL